MADAEEEEDHERQCQELLLKLKRTTESLLARQSVSGAWTTYGALRRVVDDTENILSHRIREDSATQGSEGSFWGFVQGLKWLSPSLAPMIDKVNRHSGAQKGGGGRSHPEAARAWLTESVQDHSLLPQLDILLANDEHLHSFYHASLQQGDLRLSGPPSGQGAGGGAQACDGRNPADLRADSQAIVPPTPLTDFGKVIVMVVLEHPSRQ
ncbi:hypothetical protein PoB_001576800 [Plakobranchus ocellatus]|uniref:RUN domain-containing protein n=1 Tax=Plakobranchus ocellatus TaxID=259542 RepID=A0AAV3Z3S2_9GAST|nr:hypothetical protein PoB_001576800 [Plakobranchus ocellatus]